MGITSPREIVRRAKESVDRLTGENKDVQAAYTRGLETMYSMFTHPKTRKDSLREVGALSNVLERLETNFELATRDMVMNYTAFELESIKVKLNDVAVLVSNIESKEETEGVESLLINLTEDLKGVIHHLQNSRWGGNE